MESYIIIAQYYGKSLISKLIRWRTWSPVSHTAVLTHDEQFVMEAWHKGGAQKSPWNKQPHSPGTKVVLYKVACTHEECAEFYKYMESKMGTKYDFKAIIGFILRTPLGEAAAMFCSELVFSAAQHVKIYLLLRIEPHQVSPGHINISPLLKYYKTVYTPDTP